MKVLISILIALLVGMGSYKIYNHWTAVKEERYREDRGGAVNIDPNTLSGMPYQLELRMREAQQAGPAALKGFLETCKKFPDVKDPRLAWLQLDYVVMITSTEPLEAKKLFLEVKARTPTDSPIYPRIRQMSKNYE